MQVRCSLCEDEVWVDTSQVVEHLQRMHVERAERLLRWPDGEVVVVNMDELDNPPTLEE